jgi:hypothetical protein
MECALPNNSAQPADEFASFDFNSLDFTSDYRRFLQAQVPDDVRNRALKMLWSSHETISRPDDLDDYLEDFSEEAMAIAPELARSAYQIGRGFSDADCDKAPAESDSELATEQSTAATGQSTVAASESAADPLEEQGVPAAPQHKATDLT